MKTISIVIPCFNEEGNVQATYDRTRQVFDDLPGYRYEMLFIDNASTDGTVTVLRQLASSDPDVRVIVNMRNFGPVRSPYHGFLQASGDAAVIMSADLQDPPELIPEFIRKWEEGFLLVLGVKSGSEESPFFYAIRRCYYGVVSRLSDVELVRDFMGFGLYDRRVIDTLRAMPEPYPYLRGLICELGFPKTAVTYHQPSRKRGISKNNFYGLYDMAMLGMTNHSKVPLRLVTMMGFAMSFLSIGVGFCYLLFKLVYWDSMSLGMAPLVIGLFVLSGIQLFFLGIVGEYVGAIHTQVLNRPLVVEKERINFPSSPSRCAGTP